MAEPGGMLQLQRLEQPGPAVHLAVLRVVSES